MRDSAVPQVESEIPQGGHGSETSSSSGELQEAQDSRSSDHHTHNRSSRNQEAQECQGSQESLSAPQAQGKFVIRLPPGLLKKLSRISRQHQRSMNSEINLLLGRYLEEQGLVDSNTGDENESLDARLLRKLNSMPPEKREALLHLLE